MPNESREFELDVDQIETSNLQSTYTVLYDQTQLAIRIKASDKNLAKLDTSQINASVDLNGMGVGDYEVPVKITLPDGYELVDSVKTTIHIKEKAVANKRQEQIRRETNGKRKSDREKSNRPSSSPGRNPVQTGNAI